MKTKISEYMIIPMLYTRFPYLTQSNVSSIFYVVQDFNKGNTTLDSIVFVNGYHWKVDILFREYAIETAEPKQGTVDYLLDNILKETSSDFSAN